MKRIILTVIFIFAITNVIPEDEVRQMSEELRQSVLINKTEYLKKLETLKFENFLDSLSMRESSMNPDTFNTLGFIGEFQFGRLALKDVGLEHITLEDFKENPDIFPKELQRKAVTKLMKLNYRRMNKLRNKYVGKTINGIVITDSGLLGAAHIAGAGGVNKFLRTKGKYDPADAYGTKLSDYLKKFSNHDFDLAQI